MLPSKNVTLTLLVLLALAASPAAGQDTGPNPPGKPADKHPGAPPSGAAPRPVPPPPVLGGRGLPMTPPKPPPSVEVVDEPGVGLIIDGERISRAEYGEALVEELGGGPFLEQYVLNWLFERRARKLGISVPPADVDAKFEAMKKEFMEKRKVDEAAFQAMLVQSRLTYDEWAAGRKRDIRRELLQKAVIRAERDLSEPAVKREFEARHGPDGVKRRGRYVLVSTQIWTSRLYSPEDYERERPAVEADARRRAEEALAELKAGKDFAALARERSDDPMAPQGGDHGRHWKNRFGADADRTLAALKVGETSEVLKTPRGFLIARPTELKEGHEFRARHILFQVRLMGEPDEALKARKLAEARERAARVREEIVSGKTTFEKAAAEHSDDTQNKARGGDLGTFPSGFMVAPFEAALLGLKENELSQPVETPFGVHLVQLLERKRKPENDAVSMSVLLFSTEFLKVKERKLKPDIEKRAQATADEVAAKLKAADESAAGEIARKHSDDPATRDGGGVLEEPLRPGLSSEAAEAFRSLSEPGEVKAVKGKAGFHVVKLEKIERTKLEDVKEALLAELRGREPTPPEIREFREKLRAEAKVKKGRFERPPAPGTGPAGGAPATPGAATPTAEPKGR